jgi:transcriptional regulator with AAA-type ATPase domain
MDGSNREPEIDFDWQTYFRRANEPLFLLSRRRRILFVNDSFVQRTGWSAAVVGGLLCTPRPSEEAGSLGPLARALCPPSGVLRGKTAHVRRPAPSRGQSVEHWDLDFSPFGGPDGLLGILGRIRPASDLGTLPPEPLLALREKMRQRFCLDRIDRQSAAMRLLAEQARLAAHTRVGVLIVGEPGSGKRWMAHVIHNEGPDRDKAFAAVDCRRLSATSIEETLFGDWGLTRRAEIGTIYLNDPSALPRDLQDRLAHLPPRLEGSGPRLIAGCPRDPAEEVRGGRFHEGLCCRLSTLTLTVPPLRERHGELTGLVDRLPARNGDREERTDPGLSKEAWDLIHSYPWPGNVRELQNVLLAARRRAGEATIEPAHLPAALRQSVQVQQTGGADEARSLPMDEVLEEVERRLILLALRRFQGNKSRAAEWLGIWRQRLMRRMEALGIEDADPSS